MALGQKTNPHKNPTHTQQSPNTSIQTTSIPPLTLPRSPPPHTAPPVPLNVLLWPPYAQIPYLPLPTCYSSPISSVCFEFHIGSGCQVHPLPF
ncbi:hypothetical protein Ahy_B02g060482 isoform K [Arachis hypogaea]|uniref:Uncharacterized protein n=1 Tax=Arachis hypogaea TaxID=3818 RepID=A0A445AIL2_ARAHY|nr:hypothetical protein Ahy_B02g060482 isoform K [Arachis hypogaea]